MSFCSSTWTSSFAQARKLPRLVSEVGRRTDVAGQVAEVPGELDPLGDGLAVSDAALEIGHRAPARRQQHQALEVHLGLLGLRLQPVEPVVGVLGAKDHVPRLRVGGGAGCVGGEGEQGLLHLIRREGLCRAARGLAESAGVQRIGVAQAHHQHALCRDPGEVVEDDGLAGRAVERRLGKGAPQRSSGGFVDGDGCGRQDPPHEHTEDQAVGSQFDRVAGLDAAMHRFVPRLAVAAPGPAGLCLGGGPDFG